MKFEWKQTNNDLQCLVHQEAFFVDMVEQYGLTDCNKSPRATPIKTGYPVYSIPPSTLSDEAQQKITKTYQQVMGNLNWLTILTWLDITTIYSILSVY